jgi:hypothetical protein
MTNKRNERSDLSIDRIVEQIQFNLIFAGTFVVLLGVALITLFLPWTWPRRFTSDDKRWFVGRAWDDAATFIELAYMA